MQISCWFCSLLCLSLQSVPGTSELHTLRYFYTVSDLPNLPELMIRAFVDDVEIYNYNSTKRRVVPKQDWVKDAYDQQYWETQTIIGKYSQQQFERAKQQFHRAGGVHIMNLMYGCDWDYETGEVDGYRHYGFDGEDFISLNLKEQIWIAHKQQAFISKLNLDNDKVLMSALIHYFTEECPKYLKKYVNAKRSSLMRTGDL